MPSIETNSPTGAGFQMLTKTQPEPDLFSYAALSREDEAAAREDAALVRTNSEDIARKGIEIGQALNRQNARLPHGMWLSYLRDECRLSERSAQVLMKAARDVEANPQLNAYLAGGSISVAAIDLMFARSTPTEVRDRVESLLVDGQKVTVADIRKMKAKLVSSSAPVSSASPWPGMGSRMSAPHEPLHAHPNLNNDRSVQSLGDVHDVRLGRRTHEAHSKLQTHRSPDATLAHDRHSASRIALSVKSRSVDGRVLSAGRSLRHLESAISP